MAGISSLLRSAEATRKKIRALDDQYAAFEWENSAQTADDFEAYQRYLEGQTGKTSDPSDRLTYQAKIRSARRSFISNELQREQIKIMEGGATTQDKMNAVQGLYQVAVENGDLNTAQNLISQWDSLSIKLQNEMETRAAAGRALNTQMATLRANSANDAVDTLKGYIKELGGLYKEAGPKEFQEQIKGYAKELGLAENAGFFDVYTNLAEQAISVMDNAIAAETDPSNLRSFQTKRNELVSGDAFELPGASGENIKVSLQDLKDQADAARVGETVFQQAGNGFVKQKKTGFVWGRDENGEYRQIPLYNPSTDFTSNIYRQRPVYDKNGKLVKTEYLSGSDVVAVQDKNGKVTPVGNRNVKEIQKYGYKELLENAGIQVVSTQDGQLYIRNTGNIPGFYGSPFPTDSLVPLTVGLNGELQASDGDRAFNLGFDDQGRFEGLKASSPSAITQVQGQSGRFNSRYLSTLDLNRFSPDLNTLVGIVDPNLMEKYRTRVANFNLVGGRAGTVTPSSLLQSNLDARTLQQSIQAATLQQAAQAKALQPTATAPMIQQAANPFNLPAVPNLRVAPLPPPPKLSGVSVAQPTQRITSVSVAKPKGRLVVR